MSAKSSLVNEFLKKGFVQVRNVLDSEKCSQLRKEANVLIRSHKRDWLSSVAHSNSSALFMDFESQFYESQIFFNSITDPVFFGIVEDIFDGAPAHVSSVLRICPPNPVSYVPWHIDHSQPHPLDVRVMIYLDEVQEDGGPLCYLPGSHLKGQGIPDSLSGYSSHIEGEAVLTGTQGTIILFNSIGWHRALPAKNNSRAAIIHTFGREKSRKSRLQSNSSLLNFNNSQRKLFHMEIDR